MAIVACSHCAEKFDRQHASRKFCSDRCRELNRGTDCSGCGKRVHKSRTAAAIQYCIECRKEQTRPRKEPKHGTATAYASGCRCDDCRAAATARMREYAAKRRAEGRPLRKSRALAAATCMTCHQEYQARADDLKRYKRRYCSPACRDHGQRAHFAAQGPGEHAARQREYIRINGAPGTAKRLHRDALKRQAQAAAGTTSNRTFVQGPCLTCGLPFTGIGWAARYCSDECRDINRKRDNFGYTRLERETLYARDNWTCHLCGLPTNQVPGILAPDMPTLDHVLPQAHGGTHDTDNLRTAHFWCNSFRGATPIEHMRTEETKRKLQERFTNTLKQAA